MSRFGALIGLILLVIGAILAYPGMNVDNSCGTAFSKEVCDGSRSRRKQYFTAKRCTCDQVLRNRPSCARMQPGIVVAQWWKQ
jgi:Protein of unknown function (DUF3185)